MARAIRRLPVAAARRAILLHAVAELNDVRFRSRELSVRRRQAFDAPMGRLVPLVV